MAQRDFRKVLRRLREDYPHLADRCDAVAEGLIRDEREPIPDPPILDLPAGRSGWHWYFNGSHAVEVCPSCAPPPGSAAYVRVGLHAFDAWDDIGANMEGEQTLVCNVCATTGVLG